MEPPPGSGIAPEFQRIQIETMRDFIDVRFEGKKALRRAIAAHSACNGQIGIDGIGLEEVGLRTVKTQGLMSCAASDSEAVRAICASIADRVHGDSD